MDEFFLFFNKFGFLGIIGPPYCGIRATIRIGREMLCLPYAGLFTLTKESINLQNKVMKETKRQRVEESMSLLSLYNHIKGERKNLLQKAYNLTLLIIFANFCWLLHKQSVSVSDTCRFTYAQHVFYNFHCWFHRSTRFISHVCAFQVFLTQRIQT